MEEIKSVDVQIVIGLLGVIGVLIAVIFRSVVGRLRKLENIQAHCPVSTIKTDLEQIKTDLIWIKKYFLNTSKYKNEDD